MNTRDQVIGEKFHDYTDDRTHNRRWVSVKGKMPVRPGTDTPVEWRNPENRYTWQDIQKIPGDIGIILDKTGLSCLDFDKCLDEQGKIVQGKQYVIEVLNQLDTWTEISTSGRGLHAWIVTDTNTKNEKPGPYELITDGHVKVTGNPYPPYADNPIQMVPGERLREILKPVAPKGQPVTAKGTGPLTEGGRNETLFKTAASLRGKGVSHAAILAALKAENLERCNPPLPDEEIATIAKSAGKFPAGKPGEKSEPDEINIEIKNKALEILKTRDPVAYLKDQFSKIHIGDEVIFYGLLASIGSQLCNPSDGIQPDLSGESGKGKTDACRALFHLLPVEYKMHGSFSNKSLFYHLKKPGTILFFDDAARLSEELQDMIKQSTSAFQESFVHRTVDRGVGRELPLPARLVYWITSIGANFELAFLNRQLNLSVDDSSNQDERVMTVTLERYQQGGDRFAVTEEVKICRQIFKILKDQEPVTVRIPFADKIHWNQPRNRRNLPMFLDTVNSFTTLMQYQRERGEDGAVLATREDFELAKNLWSQIGREQVGKLTRDDLRLLNCIKDNGDKTLTGEYSIERNKAKNNLRFSGYKMDLIVNGKDGTGGLQEKVEGFGVIKGTKKIGDDRTVHCDYLEYDGSLDTFGQFNDLVWITEN